MRAKVLQIVGRKKSGKTGLLVRLIPLLRARGLRVGSVKHSSHPHPLDREGTDSWRHREAGADATLAITAAAMSFHAPLPGDPRDVESLIERFVGGFDLVLIEGWASRPGPRIEVIPPDKEGRPREPRAAAHELLGVVLSPAFRPSAEVLGAHGYRLAADEAAPPPAGAGNPPASQLLCFYWDDVEAVAALIERYTWSQPPSATIV